MRGIVVFLLLVIGVSSCTITQRRYRNGFHIEWRSRLKEQPSGSAEKQLVSITDTTARQTIRLSSPETDANPEEKRSVSSPLSPASVRPKPRVQAVRHLPSVTVPVTEKAPVVSNDSKTTMHQQQSVSKERNAASELDGLGWVIAFLLILWAIIPPLVHTIMGWDPKFWWLFVLDWLVWAGGIVAIIAFVPNVWLIVLCCILWNVLFMILGSVIGEKLP